MVYAKREFATVLFPSKKEGYDNYDAMRKRIEKYLEPEDYEWAQKFTNSICHHPNYENIKKELLTTPLSMLKENHVYLQRVLNDSEYYADFLNILIEFKLINTEVWSLARFATNVKIPTGYDFSTMKNASFMFYEVGNTLLEEKNQIMANAYQSFDTKFAWAKEKPYLIEFMKDKRNSLEKLILMTYRQAISIYREKLNTIYEKYGFCFHEEINRMEQIDQQIKKRSKFYDEH